MGEGVYPKPVESSVTGLSTKTADRQGTLFSQERFIQAVIRAEASNFRTLNELDAMLPGTDLHPKVPRRKRMLFSAWFWLP